MAPDERETVMLRVWPWVTRLSIAMAILNLVLAVVVRLWGPSIHPMLVEPHTWLLFLVTGISLSAQAVLMRHTLRILRFEAGQVQARRGARAKRRDTLHRTSASTRHRGRHRRVRATPPPSPRVTPTP